MKNYQQVGVLEAEFIKDPQWDKYKMMHLSE